MAVIFVQRFLYYASPLSSPVYTSLRGGLCQDVGFLHPSHGEDGPHPPSSAVVGTGDLGPHARGLPFGSGLTPPLMFGESSDQN